MEIAVVNNNATYEVQAELEYVVLEATWAVYRITRHTHHRGGTENLMPLLNSSEITEGITTIESLQAYIRENTPLIKLPLIVAPAGLRANVARWGFTRGLALSNKDAVTLTNTPYTSIVKMGESIENLVHLDYMNHMMFDRKNKICPVGISLNYLAGNITNAHYDLQIALKILKERTGIHFEDKRAQIVEIPYYNQDVATHQLSFTIEPTQQEAQQLWEKQQSYGTTYPSTERYQAIFDLDMLGLRKGGAALFESYHDSKRDSETD